MGYNIEITQDTDVLETPRDWENLGKMVCFNKRYSLGDKHDLSSNMFNSWDELERHLIKKENAVIILPLYLYDHSGITMSTRPFSCPWDSGQVGFIYVDRQSILSEYNVKRITSKIKEKVIDVLQSEVKTYNQYLTGDIYSFTITDENDDLIDSEYEIYGYDNCENRAKEIVRMLTSPKTN